MPMAIGLVEISLWVWKWGDLHLYVCLFYGYLMDISWEVSMDCHSHCDSFLWLYWNTWDNQLTRKKYFSLWFQRFQSTIDLLHCFWACGKAEHHGKKYVVEQNYLPHGSQEAKKEIERGQDLNIPFKGKPTPPWPNFLPSFLPPYFLEIPPLPSSATDSQPSF